MLQRFRSSWKLKHYHSWLLETRSHQVKFSKLWTQSMADITTGLRRFVLMHRHMPGLLPQLSNADAGPETNVTLERFGERLGV